MKPARSTALRVFAALILIMNISCARSAPAPAPDPLLVKAFAALAGAEPELGGEAVAAIRARIEADKSGFLALLGTVLAERALDPDRFQRVDKTAHPLDPGYKPSDLVSLDGRGLRVSRSGHELRSGAYQALDAMAAAAKTEGIGLEVASAYRSYDYQARVFAREVATYGEAVARSESAEPGRSQHQLGSSVDFGPIDDVFAKTPAFAWLERRAADFGFSRSYPEGYEVVTGYRPESWHWRWLGLAAAKLQKSFFGDLQQYLIVFLADLRE
jgi:D-alanyl-D-alanine carboxypeptidase